MKKILTLILFSIAFTSASLAQGIYFRAGGGYAMPMAAQTIGSNYTRTTTTANNFNTVYTEESVSASFGAGTNFNIAGGYMFNEYLGVELNMQYTQGKKFEMSDIDSYQDANYPAEYNSTTKFYSQAIYINPSFIITTGTGTKTPYGRFGIIVGAPKVNVETSTSDYDLETSPDTNTSFEKMELNKGMSFGLQGAVGMNWMLSDKIDLFTEINFISMTYYAHEGNISESTVNGTDILSDMQTYQKETVYKKEITSNSNQQFDPTKPSEDLRVGLAFSSFSLQVGIVYTLGGHGEN